MWAGFVELLRAGIFAAAHVCGGSLGGGILLVSAGVRLALLPLTLRLARNARAQQAKLATLQPEIEALQRRFANDPTGLLRETRALHAKHGIRMLTPSGLLGMAIQFPVLGGLFAAVRTGLGAKVRFLWVSDLARPDGALLLIATALTAWGILSAPNTPGQTTNQTPILVVGVLLTAAFLWTASSAVALSAGAGSLVSVLQNWLLSRDRGAKLGSESNFIV
jgi:YidC/Oxa1 family membrane protein insertase